MFSFLPFTNTFHSSLSTWIISGYLEGVSGAFVARDDGNLLTIRYHQVLEREKDY